MQAFSLGLLLALTLPLFPFGLLAPPGPSPGLVGGFREGFWLGVGFWDLHLVWLPQQSS